MTAIIALCSWVSCGAGQAPVRTGVELPPQRCDYDVTLDEASELTVRVVCDAPVERFSASEAAMVEHVRLTVDGAAVRHDDASFALPAKTREVTYHIDLARVAKESADIDVAYEVAGPAWVSAVSTWILRPHPITRETRASIAVSVPEGMRFTSGMNRVDGRYEIWAREIRFATYGVFGHFSSETFALPGPFAFEPGEATGEAKGAEATIELVTLPGELAAAPEVRTAWVRDTARAISEFWRGFPVSHALVVLIPTAGHHGVAHGKVVAAGGAGVAIHIGSLARRADLYGDWILVHELFHLGFPSFSGEGKWLDEGLATYFEPIIRARAGWRTPHAVWNEFSNDMGQGLSAVEATGVERAESFKGIYWGGAIIALLADVKTRERTGGKLGLEDGLRAVLAEGGNASQLWKLNRAIAVIDARLGDNTLRALADAHSFTGKPVDLPKLWRDLGVSRTADELVLEQDAQLAAIRDAIISPP